MSRERNVELVTRLVLIKHSMPTISSDIPSNQWTLSEEGIRKTSLLVPKLAKYNTKKIYCSEEPKAIETAQILGKELKIEVEIIKGIHEHERNSNREIYPQGQWHKLMKKFFIKPNDLIFGEETATAAKERFSNSIHNLVNKSTDNEDIIIVTHGTVMSLFISEFNEVDVFRLWKNFGLPSYAELNTKGFKLNDIVNI